jgi:hypothetical protein
MFRFICVKKKNQNLSWVSLSSRSNFVVINILFLYFKNLNIKNKSSETTKANKTNWQPSLIFELD